MDPRFENKHAVIIGGGWSGIAAAWQLHQTGARVTLLDDQPVLGGRSRSVALADRKVTLGGKNIGEQFELLAADPLGLSVSRGSKQRREVRTTW